MLLGEEGTGVVAGHWWILAACDCAALALGLLTTTQWAKATAARLT